MYQMCSFSNDFRCDFGNTLKFQNPGRHEKSFPGSQNVCTRKSETLQKKWRTHTHIHTNISLYTISSKCVLKYTFTILYYYGLNVLIFDDFGVVLGIHYKMSESWQPPEKVLQVRKMFAHGNLRLFKKSEAHTESPSITKFKFSAKTCIFCYFCRYFRLFWCIAVYFWNPGQIHIFVQLYG